jgi:tripartite-type tricarboxylate transporter receptor subunit TctC
MSFIKKPLGVNMFKILLMSLFLFISNTCYASSIYVVVHSAAGNGADLQARVVAKHLPKHLPPNTSVGVINMPGAGGLTMANWLYNVADPNTNIAFLNGLISPPIFFFFNFCKECFHCIFFILIVSIVVHFLENC